MARNRTPTKVLELKGAFNKNPNRRRPNEPQPEYELGEPSEWLTDEEKQAWRDVASEAAPGVLTCSERSLVELYCVLRASVKARTANSTDYKTYIQCIAKLGLTATDRSKVHVNKKPKESNPFD